ncbi:hypothetical protein ACH474_19300 [Nocardia rhamnosiphila]|uniref:Uncharacterized protein n=1 Tax=Nocardia rhamnosiphila TaxID=426716 RepID=A0ABV2WS54_9NOCA|nr:MULTISPECIES: hypothetical protein [Nocardia]MCX0270124.1 hypothetical protein [Nocardia zapadnayensis]
MTAVAPARADGAMMGAVDPQVIEVVQSSPAWWQSWLPLLGSLVLGGVAVIAVLVNNRTNRDAIAAADERAQRTLAAAAQQQNDSAKRQVDTTRLQLDAAHHQVESAHAVALGQAGENWRRGTVVTAIADTLSMSGRICQALRRDEEWTDELIGDLIHDLEDGSERANVLRLVGSDQHYKQWRRLADTLSDGLLAALTLQRKKLQDAPAEEIRAARDHKNQLLGEVRAAERELIGATREELEIEPN